MSRPIYVYWKRGDNGRFKHGMEVGVYDPVEWGHDEIQEMMHFSPWMQTVYQITIHSREEKAEYVDGLTPVGPKNDMGNYDTNHADYRASSKMLDTDKLKSVSGDLDIEYKLKSGKHQDKIDCRTNKKIAKETSSVTFFPHVTDLRVITSGDYSHGTAGDYSDIIALLADIGTVAGDFEFTQISSQNLSSQVVLSTPFLTYTADFISSSPHAGDINSGWSINSTYSAGSCINIAHTADTAFTLNFRDISVNYTGSGASDSVITFDNRANTAVYNIGNLFFNGNSLAGVGSYCRCVGSSAHINLYNLSYRDCSTYGMWVTNNTSGNMRFEQWLIENCGTGLEAGSFSNIDVVNCGFVNNGTADVSNIGSADGVFNITSDASGANGNWGTGTNCIAGVSTPTNEWDLDDTSSDYAGVLATAPNAASSTTSPTLSSNLMDKVWTNEIGCKAKIGGGSYPAWLNLQKINSSLLAR